jgi:ferredoxin
MRVSVELERCVGAGQCVLTAPAVFDQDDDGIVMLLTDRPGPDEQNEVHDAVQSCPSRSIRAHQD